MSENRKCKNLLIIYIHNVNIDYAQRPHYVLNSVLKRHLILSRDFYETFRFNNKVVKFKFSRKVTKTRWNLPPDLVFTLGSSMYYVIMFWDFSDPPPFSDYVHIDPPPPFCDYVIHGCSLSRFHFKWKISSNLFGLFR